MPDNRLREAEGLLDALLFVDRDDELERAKDRIREFLARQPLPSPPTDKEPIG